MVGFDQGDFSRGWAGENDENEGRGATGVYEGAAGDAAGEGTEYRTEVEEKSPPPSVPSPPKPSSVSPPPPLSLKSSIIMRGWAKVLSPDKSDSPDPVYSYVDRYVVLDHGKSYLKVFVVEPAEEVLFRSDRPDGKKRRTFDDP